MMKGSEALIIESCQITDLLQHSIQNTLVLLNIDNTLIELAQLLGSPEWCLQFEAAEQKLGSSATEALVNALKFTTTGYVTVSVLLAKQTGRKLVIQLEIEDSGPGIPEEKQQQLF